MPLGYQNRSKFGPRVRFFGSNGPGQNFDGSGLPLIGYDAVFTYRSGKSSKFLSNQGNSYASLVETGSLVDQLRRRNEFLQMQIDDLLEPTTGSTTAFSTSDTGHPFATLKISATPTYARASVLVPPYSSIMDVCFAPYVPYPDFSNPFGLGYKDVNIAGGRLTYFSWPSNFLFGTAISTPIVTNSVKNAVGSGVIASANPWAPKASLAQTIIELLSGDVPSILKNLRKHLADLQSLKKTIGSDWLNVQFGWVPLISDIRATIEVLLKLHMLLYGSDNYRRTRGGDLGEWARVTENPYDTSIYVGSPLAPSALSAQYFADKMGSSAPLLYPGNIPGGQWSRSSRITADFRFTARYHRGAQPNSRERGFIERATELLGLEITPAVLWEITPWTWLLDWASNLGSVATNLSTLDWSNVLLDYAYLTFFVKTEASISWSGSLKPSPYLTMSHGFVSTGYHVEEKIREQASPYGFSVNWDGLSPFQISILAALGMSRGR